MNTEGLCQMDHNEIRSQIINLLKEKTRVRYKDLEVTLGCNTEDISNVCETLRFERLATDIDDVGIEAMDALYQIPMSSKVSPPHVTISNPKNLGLHSPDCNSIELSLDHNIEDISDSEPSEISIFISYGRRGDGIALAERLEKDLLDKKYQVYRDVNQERGLQGGHFWEWELEKQIESMSIFISIITCHAVRRPEGYCLDEISLARSLKKKIIPLLVETHEEGRPCRPPLCIHRLNFLDYQKWNTEYEQKLPTLIRAIHAEQMYDGLSIRLLSGQGTLMMSELDFTGEIGRKAKGFVGRSWLIDIIDEWLNEPNDQVFLLRGGPGTGKSAFLAYLAQHHPAVKAIHFCIRAHEATWNPKQFILSLASMIASQIPVYKKKLDSLVQSDSFLLKCPGDLFWDLIIHPLEEQMPGQERVLIVIDALDESVKMELGQSQIVNLLSENIRGNRIPNWIKFLISTRPVPSVLSGFEEYPGCDLIESEPLLNQKDIQDFLKVKITSSDFQKTIQKEIGDIKPEKLEEMLLSASNGNFLYLTLILEDIKKGRIKPSDQSFFPSGLSGYYRENFDRIYKDKDRFKKTRAILDIILAAREPLPVWHIGELLNITPKRVEELLEPIHPFLEIEGSQDEMIYRPFHSSFSDWLIGEKIGKDASVKYKADLIKGHQLVSRYLEKRYGNGISNRFVLNHLPYHLFKAGQFKEYGDLLLNIQFLNEKIRENTLGIQSLIEDYSLAQGSNRIEHDISNEMLQALNLIGGALVLSSHVLTQKPNQLPNQLVGRLIGIENRFIRQFVDQIKQFYIDTTWLRPISPAFNPPGGSLLRTLAGHTNLIFSVAVTPDSKKAISGSGDNTLKVWDIKTGKELRTLIGHIDYVTTVAVSPDGRKAVSGSYDNTLKVWDIETGKELHTLIGHTNWVNTVIVTPHSQRAVSGSVDNTLKVWDIETGKELHSLIGHIDYITTVAVSPDGRKVISGSRDNSLKVWDIETGKELHTLLGHSNYITTIRVSPDGRRVVSGSRDNSLKVWDIETGKELHTLLGHTNWVNTLTITLDGRWAVSGSYDNTLKIWDLMTGKKHHNITGHTNWVREISVTQDGCRAISGSGDNTLKVWDIKTGKELRTLIGHTRGINTVAVTPDGRKSISGSGDNTLKVWDNETGKELLSLIDHSFWVNVVVVTPDGQKAISGSSDNTLKIWDLITGRLLLTLIGHGDSIIALAVTPDGHQVISGSYDNSLKIWDIISGKELITLTGHTNWISTVVVTPDGRKAISGSYDNSLKIWDIISGKELITLTGHTNWISTVAVTPDGRRVISGSKDNTLKVWDIISGQELVTLSGHTDFIYKVVVSSDGQRVISGSRDNTMKVWDLESGMIIAEFYAEGAIYAISETGTSNSIIAGDSGGRIYFLRLEETTSVTPIITAD